MADSDNLAKLIQQRMSAKNAAGSQSEAAKDFLSRYEGKMKMPAGMKAGDISEETARLGMKLPKEIANPRLSALKRLAGKTGKVVGPAAGIAGALIQEELNPEGDIVEDPDVPLEIRAMAAKAREAQMREEGAEEQDLMKRKAAREERLQALMEKLREESGQ